MTCRYHFKVESYYSLDAMACYQCPEVIEDCYRPDCIVANCQGQIKMINNMFLQLFNPLLGDEPGTIRVDQLKNLIPINPELTSQPYHKMFLQLSFDAVDNPTSYRSPFYGYSNVSENLRILTPNINQIIYDEAKIPLLLDRSDKDICYYEKKRNCQGDFCICTHVLPFERNRVVELLIYDTGAYDAHQSMHLHGYGFHVVAWKRVGKTLSVAEIRDLDYRGLIERNFDNAIQKDTIHVPRGGYVVVRFKTDNPGYWKFHTFVDVYSIGGMRMALKVTGARSPPSNFPQCNSYLN